MADDCRAQLAVLRAELELDEVFHDRPSDCDLRAAESIYFSDRYHRDGVRADRKRWPCGPGQDSGMLYRKRRTRRPAASPHSRTPLPHS